MLKLEIPQQHKLEGFRKAHGQVKRITSKPKQKIKRKRGRPKGRKNRPRLSSFELTPAGYFLCHNCETEWLMLSRLMDDGVRVSYRTLLSLSYSSDNPAFRSEEWRLALIDYKKYGKRTPNAVKPSLEAEIGHIMTKLSKGLEGGLQPFGKLF